MPAAPDARAAHALVPCCDLPAGATLVAEPGESCCQEAAAVTDAERSCSRHGDCTRLNGDVVVNRASWSQVKARLARHVCPRSADADLGLSEACVANRCVLVRR